MQKYARVRQSKTLSRFARCQQYCRHAGCLSKTERRNRTLYILHGVINGKSCGNEPAGGIDIDIDILSRILRLKKQHLGYYNVGKVIIHGPAKKNYPVFQEPGINIIGTLASIGLFNHKGYQLHYWT
jgi:hypothetical protein